MIEIEEGFAILYKCKEAIAHDKSVMTKEGTPAWLTDSDGYWWGKPFSDFYTPKVNRDNPPNDVIVFKTREEAAEQFRQAKKGNHIGAWYHAPGKEFEVIAVKRKYKTVPDGYEVVK